LQVALDPGSFQVPTPMFQGMCERRFTVGEMRTALTVLRLLQRRSRDRSRDRTLRISHADLARETGVRFSGAFVRGVRQLIDRGVLVVVEPSSGRRPPSYTLRTRPEQWRGPVQQPETRPPDAVGNPALTNPEGRPPTKPRYLSVRHSRHAAQLAG
jgi:hypothetical protein